ncbi:MAG TPA: septation protein SepH [Trebonia sp.]|nr:septation protein SepH [Trebonia sp.]
MQELRFVAVSEDGSYAVVAVPGRSARFTLPIDERLRAVALGQTSRLAQYEIEVESPLRPKEIQARIRAGETAEEIADAAGIPVERVRWFEGPVLAERAHIASQSQAATVRRQGDSSGPGPRLGDIVPERLSAAGADPDDGQWDSRKRGDGNWQVQLTFSSGGRLHIAEWIFDPRRRHVMPDDDLAGRLSLPESELPPLPVTVPGEATVTPLAPRLGAAAGMGSGVSPAPVGGGLGGGQGARLRSERPVAAERPVAPERPVAAERPAMSHAPVVSRPAHRDPAAYRDAAPEPPAPAPQPQVAAHSTFPDSERPRLTPQHPPAPAPEPEVTRGQAPAASHQPPTAPGQHRHPQEPLTANAPAAPPAPAQPVVPEPTVPVAQEPATTAHQPVAAGEESGEAAVDEQAARSRPGKKNARGRRSSVPSWDEIMLGSSRQRD